MIQELSLGLSQTQIAQASSEQVSNRASDSCPVLLGVGGSAEKMSVADAWIIIDEGGVLRMLDDDEVNEMIGVRRGLPEGAIENYTVCYTFTGAQQLEDEVCRLKWLCS